MRNLNRYKILNPLLYNADKVILVQATYILNSVRFKVYEDYLKATSNIKEPKQLLKFCPCRDTNLILRYGEPY